MQKGWQIVRSKAATDKQRKALVLLGYPIALIATLDRLEASAVIRGGIEELMSLRGLTPEMTK